MPDFVLPAPTVRQVPKHRIDRAELQSAPDGSGIARLATEVQSRAAEIGIRLSATEAVDRVMKQLNRKDT